MTDEATLVGAINRVDLIDGGKVPIKVALIAADAASIVANAWRPDTTSRRSFGAIFNWEAVARVSPERPLLRAQWQSTAVAMMQLEEDYPPLRSRPTESRAVYVSFLEVAPQQRTGSPFRRFAGLGAAMLSFAVAQSRHLGFGGRVGIHTVRQAQSFYVGLGFQAVALPGPNEYWESYLELPPTAAGELLQDGTEG